MSLSSIFGTGLSGRSGLVAGRPLVVRARACVADGRLFGAFDGGQMIGSARFYDLRQWWYGRALPLAGVGDVKVAPEERGRGIGRALMTEMLSAMNERGYPLSVLYPSARGLLPCGRLGTGGRAQPAQGPGRR